MVKLNHADIFIPDGGSTETALSRTTHLAIAAHQDDIEIMAIDGILQCYQNQDQWFSSVVVTDGRSSPRSGPYENLSDEEMIKVRNEEQKKAASIGRYSAQIILGYQSGEVKRKNTAALVQDLLSIFQATRPTFVYLHNLTDKHPTHVAVALRAIESLRQLEKTLRPKAIYGCEVWRSLDWVQDNSKVSFNCSEMLELQKSLLSVFDTQNRGGKRYDLATMGRRLANATFLNPLDTSHATHLTFSMDLTPLIVDPDLDITEYVRGYIKQFLIEVEDVIRGVS